MPTAATTEAIRKGTSTAQKGASEPASRTRAPSTCFSLAGCSNTDGRLLGAEKRGRSEGWARASAGSIGWEPLGLKLGETGLGG